MEKFHIEKIFDQEPIKSSGLKLLGIGSNKIVFETIGSDRKVVKIEVAALWEKIENVLEDSPTPDTISDQQKANIKEEFEQDKEASEVFGKEHFLRRGMFKIKVPITKEILLAIADSQEKEFENPKEISDDFYQEIEMIAETQLIAEELKNPEKFSTISFHTGIMEKESFFSNFTTIDDALLYIRSIKEQYFLQKFETLAQDEKYKPTVVEIVKNIIQYTKKTGRMIDIFGKNNITLFTKEDGSIDYHALEVALPDSQEYWNKNIKDDPQFYLLRHYYTFYYAIKTLADKIGIQNNLELDDLVYFKGASIPTGKFPKSE